MFQKKRISPLTWLMLVLLILSVAAICAIVLSVWIPILKDFNSGSALGRGL